MFNHAASITPHNHISTILFHRPTTLSSSVIDQLLCLRRAHAVACLHPSNNRPTLLYPSAKHPATHQPTHTRCSRYMYCMNLITPSNHTMNHSPLRLLLLHCQSQRNNHLGCSHTPVALHHSHQSDQLRYISTILRRAVLHHICSVRLLHQ